MKTVKSMKIILFICLVEIFFFSALAWCAGANRKSGGSLVIIGGALQPDNEAIYQKFIHLGGGKNNINIAIIPAASINPVRSGTSYVNDFQEYGIPGNRIKIFPLALTDDPSTKDVDESKWSGNGFKKELAEEMLNYNAVFFVGGDQARYLQTLKDKNGNDSPLLVSIRRVYEKGGVIGGTSAGAAIMSDPMICGGTPINAMINGVNYQPDQCPSEGGALLTRGLGFITMGLVDQHFIKRGRSGRLISVLLHQENLSFGIGVDEDTAAVYCGKTETIEVCGRSAVLLVDTRKAMKTPHLNGILVKNITLHYLEEGDIYFTETGKFTINPDRKKIEPGKEYNKSYSLHTNVFGKDAFMEIITSGLVDNLQKEAVGIAFVLEQYKKDTSGKNFSSGNGVKLVFKKNEQTTGYWARINGKSTYSALHVLLDIIPITVQIME